MKARMFLALAMLLVLLMAGSMPAVADGADVPFYYASPTQIVITRVGPTSMDLAITGTGTATHLGLTTWVSTCTVTFGSPNTQDCTMTFTAANGDTFAGETHGWARPSGTDTVFWGTFIMTDGTGRLEGQSVSGDYEGTASLVTNTGMIVYDGILTKPLKP